MMPAGKYISRSDKTLRVKSVTTCIPFDTIQSEEWEQLNTNNTYWGEESPVHLHHCPQGNVKASSE